MEVQNKELQTAYKRGRYGSSWATAPMTFTHQCLLKCTCFMALYDTIIEGGGFLKLLNR
jgi:hypothetical protein